MKIFEKKYFIIPFSMLFLILFSSALFYGQCKSRGKMLVLGFDSRLINDIQDRLLRETILRELHKQGYSIVTVMDFESVFHDSSGKYIRKPDLNDLKRFCSEFNADYALTGKIFPKDGNKALEKIVPDNLYICSIILYQKNMDKFYKLTLETRGKKSFYEYFLYLSEKIVAGLNGVIRK